VLADRLARTVGLGRTIVGSAALGAIASFLVPLAAGPQPVIVATLMIAMFVTGLSSPIYNINQVSLRQAITPDRLQGRMNASMRFIVWGTIPIGALLGGTLGDFVGLCATVRAVVPSPHTKGAPRNGPGRLRGSRSAWPSPTACPQGDATAGTRRFGPSHSFASRKPALATRAAAPARSRTAPATSCPQADATAGTRWFGPPALPR
jgi:hypothetical protein